MQAKQDADPIWGVGFAEVDCNELETELESK